MRTLPRFTAALVLGTLGAMALTAAYGSWLVRDARLDQAARSTRLHELGRIAVPRPDLMAGMTWRDDLAAGLFYGLFAGWPLGGLLSLMVMGLDLRGRSRAWIYGAAGLLFLAIAATEAVPELVRARAQLDAGRAPLAAKTAMEALWTPGLWILLLAAVELGALALPPSRVRLAGFLLATGLVLAFLLRDPVAPVSTLLLALALPWAVLIWMRPAWRAA